MSPTTRAALGSRHSSPIMRENLTLPSLVRPAHRRLTRGGSMSDIKWTLAVAQLDCASGRIVASPRWSGSVARLSAEAFSLSSAEAATTGYFRGAGLHELAEPADVRFHRGSHRSRVTAAFTSPSALISSPVNA